MLKRMSLLRPSHYLSPTCQLLTEGGDNRILLDPICMVNKYGRRPIPDPELAAFGSSTASTISEGGFAAAEALRWRLFQALDRETPPETYLREIGRIRRELIHLCGLSEFTGLQTIFAPSGTELHMLAARLVARGGAARTLAIMIDPAETGSGVKDALGGHICPRYALNDGRASTAHKRHLIDVATVAIRAADGRPLLPETADDKVEALVSAAQSGYERILIVIADVSKTGVIAPSPSRVLELKAQWPRIVEVLVDAAQFRLAPASLHSYLAHDCMVAVTGSKFLTGPSFSAVLLVPRAAAHRLTGYPLDHALSAVSTRAEWPENWAGVEVLPQAANYGLLLRWEAALAELRAFRAVPQMDVIRFLEAFSQAILSRLNSDPHFELLAQPGLDRRPLVTGEYWDRYPTIFPFLLYRITPTGTRILLTADETKRIYNNIGANIAETNNSYHLWQATGTLRCELGQPVLCGVRQGVEISALRLCIGARTIVEYASYEKIYDDRIIERALMTLNKISLLIDGSWKRMM